MPRRLVREKRLTLASDQRYMHNKNSQYPVTILIPVMPLLLVSGKGLVRPSQVRRHSLDLSPASSGGRREGLGYRGGGGSGGNLLRPLSSSLVAGMEEEEEQEGFGNGSEGDKRLLTGIAKEQQKGTLLAMRMSEGGEKSKSSVAGMQGVSGEALGFWGVARGLRAEEQVAGSGGFREEGERSGGGSGVGRGDTNNVRDPALDGELVRLEASLHVKDVLRFRCACSLIYVCGHAMLHFDTKQSFNFWKNAWVVVSATFFAGSLCTEVHDF